MIKTTWNVKAMWQQKDSRKPDCPLATTSKEAKYVYAFLLCDLFQQNR